MTAVAEDDLRGRGAAVAALPSQTSLRFVVLVTAVLMSSIYVYDSVYFTLHLQSERDLVQRCLVAGASVPDVAGSVAAEIACRAPQQQTRVLWVALFAPATFALAVAVAAAAPRLRRWRHGLVALPAEVAAVHQRTASLADTLELHRHPVLTWQPRRVSGAATAYGTPWRPRVEISPGTTALAFVDQRRFDGIVLHELAHVRNGDVLIGGVTAGSFVAFVVVADVPFLASLLVPGLSIGAVLSATTRLALLTLLVLLVQREVLRVREHEADLRAFSVAPGYTLPLVAGRSTRWWRAAFQTHPDDSARRRVLERPERLLESSPAQAAVAGFFALLPVPTATSLATGWLSGTGLGLTGGFVIGTLLTLPLGAWTGVLALRLASDRRNVRSGVALGAATGLGGGLALAVADDPLYQPVSLLSGRVVDLLALVAFVAVVTGVVMWLVAVARQCRRRNWSTRRSAVFLALLGAAMTSLVLGTLARVWTLSVATDAGRSIGKDAPFVFVEILVGGVSRSLGVAFLVLLVLPVVLLGRIRGAPAVRAAAVVCVSGTVGWAVVRLADARFRAITTAEVREQVIIVHRRVLVDQALGVTVSAVVAVGLMVIARAAMTTLVATAVGAVVVMVGLQVLSAAGDRGVGDTLDAVLPAAALGALLVLGVTPLVPLAHRLSLPGGWRIWPVALLWVALSLVVEWPVAAYAAAPQPTLREAVSLDSWFGGNGAVVLRTLDFCAGLASGDSPPLDDPEAAAALIDDVGVTAAAPSWHSGPLRRLQTAMVTGLERCEAGARAEAAREPDEALRSYRQSLCTYWGLLATLSTIGGTDAQVPASVVIECGGRPSA